MIKNRIYKTELIEWQKVKDLQPDNLKLPYNYENIKNSILKYGVSKAYDVCEIDGELYWIDGHTRTQIMLELLNDGIKIPDKLTANFCEVKDKKEAIEILLEVHNQRQNPIAEEVLTEWVEIEQISVNVQSLNVKIEQIHETENEPDYSLLDDDDEDLQRQTDQMTAGVKKAIQIEFEAEHYEDAYALVKFWREQNAYVGGMIMEYLKSEKEKI